ncbi:MAG TPA: PP2C family protein-serine/threonine phosphatase [Thermoanaerobaculia bacterium]|nr:PP2C family protein-serine/threonine phosphatase [Thermoanaerobaculia bacterium]
MKQTALAALAAGALLFAAGMALARARLPEWRPGPLPDRQVLEREFAAFTARCGLRPLGVGPRLLVVESSRRRRAGAELPLTSAAASATVAISATQQAVTAVKNATAGAQTLTVWFDAGGRPQAVRWQPSGREVAVLLGGRPVTPLPGLRPDAFVAALLAPGERLGPPLQRFVAGAPIWLYSIPGSTPPQHVTATAVSVLVDASRNPGGVVDAVSEWDRIDPLAGSGERVARQLTLLVLAGVFCVLAIRRRLGLANGAWLAGLTGLALLPPALRQPSAAEAVNAIVALVVETAWLAVLWSAAESRWRADDPHFDATLDLLRARRLTRHAGAALLGGVGLGAAAAGLSLAVYATAAALAHAHTYALSVDLPVLDGAAGPLAAAIADAAVVGLLFAFGRRLSRRRWVPYAAALATAVAFSPVQLRPWPLELAGGVLVAGALVAAADLGGPAALLAAALCHRLLPAAVFSALHLSWLAGGFAMAAGALAVLVVTGAAAMLRPRGARDVDDGLAPPPAFMLRLERERRLEVEMELLARMQVGLLPSRLPAVPGWEIAATSLLADRAGGDLYDFAPDWAGRWWIAAGDVAGHGFSCAIAQAMIKAALASLLGAASSPAAVLAETDRVLRTAAAVRSFTSLALLRLDPATGEGLLANAGHPYPLLAEPGQPARELALPGLPLGQGPPRVYADLPLALVPGAALVLCSDGLFEASSGGRTGGAPYGYERPLRLLSRLAGRPAAEILDGLLADWRIYRGPGAPEDDTTMVVLRRLPAPRQDPEPSR